MVITFIVSSSDEVTLERFLITNGWTIAKPGSGDAALERPEQDAEAVARIVTASLGESDDSIRRLIARHKRHGGRVILVLPTAIDARERTSLMRMMRAGADDFVTITNLDQELALRLAVIDCRFAGAKQVMTRSFFGLHLDREGRRLRHGKTAVSLTPGEFRVLSCLARQPGRVIPRATLHACMARDGRPVTTNLVDVYILYVRRKLARLNSQCIVRTVRGVGYVLSQKGETTIPGERWVGEKRDWKRDPLAS